MNFYIDRYKNSSNQMNSNQIKFHRIHNKLNYFLFIMELYKLYKSKLKTKKYDVYILNPNTDRIKKISFGAKDYDDYTTHKDKERRERYRNRHKKDNIDNPLYAGFWSWYVLWGDSSNIDTAFKKAVRLCKKLLKNS